MWFARLERAKSTSGKSSLEGGSKGTPLVVENAGHEHLWTHSEIAKAMLGLLRSKDVRRAKARAPPISTSATMIQPTVCRISTSLPVDTPPSGFEARIFSHHADSAAHECHTARFQSESHIVGPQARIFQIE